MDQSQPAGKIRITRAAKQTQAAPDDSFPWMGGEATVGAQANRYLRRQEGRAPGLVLTILGLTFLGGLAVGSLVSSFLRKGS